MTLEGLAVITQALAEEILDGVETVAEICYTSTVSRKAESGIVYVTTRPCCRCGELSEREAERVSATDRAIARYLGTAVSL
jgi:hypothetical protein